MRFDILKFGIAGLAIFGSTVPALAGPSSLLSNNAWTALSHSGEALSSAVAQTAKIVKVAAPSGFFAMSSRRNQGISAPRMLSMIILSGVTAAVDARRHAHALAISPSLMVPALISTARSGDAGLGCSHCTGSWQVRAYVDDIHGTGYNAQVDWAFDAIKQWMGECSTGGQTQLNGYDGSDCDGFGGCTYWTGNLIFWRYCGARPSLRGLHITSQYTPRGHPTMYTDMWVDVDCYDRVKCAGTCDCLKCHC